MEYLTTTASVKVPPIKEFIQLNELLTSGCGVLTEATTIGIALNTANLDDIAAQHSIGTLEDESGLPVTDVVRYGARKLAAALL